MPRRQPGVTKYTTSDGRTFWQYVVDLGDDPKTGRRRQRHKRGFPTQTEAAAALDDAHRAIEVGGHLFDVEHLTFVCTPHEYEAGPNNNWMEPDDARAKMEALFAGCMEGRTMYVIPYCMGPIDSPYARLGVEIQTTSPLRLSKAK